MARSHLRRTRRDRQVDQQGSDRQRHHARRQGRNPRQHAPRMDLLRLRRALRRRERRADLPDATRPKSASTCSSTPRRRSSSSRTASSSTKIKQVREQPHHPRDRRDHRPRRRRPRRGDLARRAQAAGPERRDDEFEHARRGRHARRPLHDHLHLGHDGSAEGLHDHPRATTATPRRWASARSSATRRRSIYLFLPLAHSFALLVQFAGFDVGATIAYWERDAAEDHPEPDGAQARRTSQRAAHLREDLHARQHGRRRRRRRKSRRCSTRRSRSACKVRDAAGRGRRGPRRTAGGLRGGRRAGLLDGPQPVRWPDQACRHRRGADRRRDPRVLLRLRRARLRGLRHDRDRHPVDRQQRDRGFQFGSVGKPVPGVHGRASPKTARS